MAARKFWRRLKEEGEKIQKEIGDKLSRERLAKAENGRRGKKDGRAIWWGERERERERIGQEDIGLDFRKKNGKRPESWAHARTNAARSRGLAVGGKSRTSVSGRSN